MLDVTLFGAAAGLVAYLLLRLFPLAGERKRFSSDSWRSRTRRETVARSNRARPDAMVLALGRVQAVIRELRISDLVRVKQEEQWIQLELVAEKRTQWIGYEKGRGYFLNSAREQRPQAFFPLESLSVELVGLLPAAVKDSLGEKGERLVKTLINPRPDPEEVERVVKALPATQRGLDALAVAATLRSFQSVVENLRDLLDGAHDESPAERIFQDFVAEHPWLLGTQYESVLGFEWPASVDCRVDLLFRTALGHMEVVEVKRPDKKPLVAGSAKNVWKASSDLSDAIAQAQKYLREFDKGYLRIRDQLEDERSYTPRIYRTGVVVVIGRRPETKHARDALRDINANQPRILVLTYDDLIAIGESTIEMLRNRLNCETA